MKNLFLSIALIILGANAQSVQLGEETYLQYKGEIGLEGSYFFADPKVDNQIDRIGLINSSFDLTLQSAYSLDLRLKPRFYYEPNDNDLKFEQGQITGKSKTRLYLEEFYLDYYSDFIEMRAGYQTWAWKTVESFSQTDFLNQTDLQIDFFDPPKYGELALKFNFIIPTENEQIVELTYLPYFQSTRQPIGNSRFNPFATFPFDYNNKSDDALYNGKYEKWSPQFALRFKSVAFDNTDYSVFGFYGYDRQALPLADLNDGSTGFPIQILANYEKSIKGGLNFQSALDAWLVKGEFIYHQFEKDSIKSSRILDNSSIQDQYQYAYKKNKPSIGATAGVEYTLYSPIIDGHDIGLIVEGIYSSDTHLNDDEILKFNPFKNHAFVGIRYVFNNPSDRTLLLGGFSSLKEIETLGRLEYEERLFNTFKIKIRALLLHGEKGSALENFSSNHRIDGQLTYNF